MLPLALRLLTASLLVLLLLLLLLPPSAARAVRLPLRAALLVHAVPGTSLLGRRDHIAAARHNLIREISHAASGRFIVAAGQRICGAALSLGELWRGRGVTGSLPERLGQLVLRVLGQLVGLGAQLRNGASGLLVVAASDRVSGLMPGRDLIERLRQPVQ